MRYFSPVFIFLFLSLCPGPGSGGEMFRVDGVEFHYRKPGNPDSASGIMVLFGGRNWSGDRTLAAFEFGSLADKHNLFLLSPSFRDRDYWEPEKWSGKALLNGIAELEKRFHLNSRKLYFYGYSAGGQCANLFFAYMPERVAAWGAHGCGVYFTKKMENPFRRCLPAEKRIPTVWRSAECFFTGTVKPGESCSGRYIPAVMN